MLRKGFQILFAVVFLWGAVAPVFGPGAAAVDSRLPDQKPEQCIENPKRSGASGSPTVLGKVSHTGANVTITYSLLEENSSGSTLQVNLPQGSDLVSQTGFQTATFGTGLYWNNSSSTHSITYRMASRETPSGREVTYSHAQQWVVAGAPDHHFASVELSPVGSGYIGGNILYLGQYNTKTRQVGCQEFVVVVPSDARMFDTDGRLDELESAATALPVGHKYKTVRVFVSPKDLGDAGGFVPNGQNEIVLIDNPTPGYAPVLWMHEYIHTVQGFESKPELSWVTEGSATYLSLRVAVEHGEISPRSYDYYLRRGVREFDTSMIGAQAAPVAYRRGAVVLSILDRELWTTYDRSVVGLLAELNQDPNPGTTDIVRWLRDDVRMDAHGAEHTVQLVEDGEVLHPPLILTESDTPDGLLLLLSLFSAPVVRGLSMFLGISGVVAYVYSERFESEGES